MQRGSWPLLLTAYRDSTNKRMLSAVSLRTVHPSEVQMTSRRSLCSAIAGVAFVAAAAAAEGEAWPTRAIQVISPFTAGNANDTVARVVLDQVSRQLGHAFVLAQLASRAAPDFALRSNPRLCAGGRVRNSAQRAGGCAVDGLQNGCRPGGGREGHADHSGKIGEARRPAAA